MSSEEKINLNEINKEFDILLSDEFHYHEDNNSLENYKNFFEESDVFLFLEFEKQNQNEDETFKHIQIKEENENFDNKNVKQPLELELLDNKSTTKKTENSRNNNIQIKGRADNKIIKIKTFLVNNFHTFANNLLAKKNKKLCKLSPAFTESIKKDVNIKLWGMTFKDIYLSSKLAGKFRKQKWINHNKKIIDYIYNNTANKNIKDLFDLTFSDAFEIFFRREEITDLNQKISDQNILSQILDHKKFSGLEEFYVFIRQTFKKKSKSEEYINSYIYGSEEETGIKDLCYNIESWFTKKKGRNRNNRIIFSHPED